MRVGDGRIGQLQQHGGGEGQRPAGAVEHGAGGGSLGSGPLREHRQGQQQQDEKAADAGKGVHRKGRWLMDGSKVRRPISGVKNIIPTP